MNFFKLFLSLFHFDRTNWKAVALCVVASFVFWIFNSLNKQHTTDLKFPLLFEFNGEKYAIAQHLPKSIVLNVTGRGWDLLRNGVGVKVPTITIPLDRPNTVQKIVGSSMLPLLAGQVENFKINYVVTDALEVRIDKKYQRRYKLVADISAVSFKKGYARVSPISISPDSVVITGPEHVLRGLPDSIVVKMEKKKTAEDVKNETEISFAQSEFTKITPSLVRVQFEVAEVKTVELKLKVAAEKISVKRDTVQVAFQIPVSKEVDFEKKSKEITLRVDVGSLKKHKKAMPSLQNLPTYAKPLKIDTVFGN